MGLVGTPARLEKYGKVEWDISYQSIRLTDVNRG